MAFGAVIVTACSARGKGVGQEQEWITYLVLRNKKAPARTEWRNMKLHPRHYLRAFAVPRTHMPFQPPSSTTSGCDFFQLITDLQIYGQTMSNNFVRMVSFVLWHTQKRPFSFTNVHTYTNVQISFTEGKTPRIPPFIAWHFCRAVTHKTTLILHTWVMFLILEYPHVHLHYVFIFDLPTFWINAFTLPHFRESYFSIPLATVPGIWRQPNWTLLDRFNGFMLPRILLIVRPLFIYLTCD